MREEEVGFEQKIERAKELLEKLMQPDITLEESVKLYEEGMRVTKEAQSMIEEAKLKVEVIEQRIWQSKEDKEDNE